jgi:KDO2-lipid IV(A) lauroyltransferase
MQPTVPQTPDAAPGAATALEPMSAARPPGEEERRVGLYSRLKFEAVRTFLLAWARVFSLRGLYLLGRWFGAIEYLVNYKRRARYRRELQRVFPEGLSAGRVRQIVRNYFQRTRCDKLFYLIFDRLPRDRIMRRIRFHGREYLDQGLARGRGVYVMLSHHGSHHVAGLLMALMGYRCAGIRDRNEGPLRQYMQQKYAETFPEFAAIRLLYADTFPREIYRCFQDNFIVGSALDVARVRGMTLKTCQVQVFGETREFLTGTAQIALRSRAAIVQGFVVSRPNFYFRLVVRPLELPPEAEGDRPEVLTELMQRYADGIAAHAREHPDHFSRT